MYKIKLDEKLNNEFTLTFLEDMLKRSEIEVDFVDEININDDNSYYIKTGNMSDIDNNTNRKIEYVVIEKPNIHKVTDKDQYFTYKGYMFLHMRASSDKYIIYACMAIEVMEALSRIGFSINEKGIYQSIFNCFINE